MENLEDKIRNKISLFNAVNFNIKDRETYLVKLFSPPLRKDYHGLILLSEEHQKPDLKKKIERLKRYTLLVEKFCEKEDGDIDELAKKTKGLDSLIKKIIELSKD